MDDEYFEFDTNENDPESEIDAGFEEDFCNLCGVPLLEAEDIVKALSATEEELPLYAAQLTRYALKIVKYRIEQSILLPVDQVKDIKVLFIKLGIA